MKNYKIFKDKIYRLYRMSANLNLYMYLCDVRADRFKKELTDIRDFADEILKQWSKENKDEDEIKNKHNLWEIFL